MKGVFLDRQTMGDGIDFTHLQHCFQQLEFFEHSNSDQVATRVDGVDVVITNKVPISAELMAMANFKMIAIAATGTDHVDLEAAKHHGILVRNVQDYCTASVAQHTIGLMLALATRINSYHQDVQNGRWSDSPVFCFLDHPIVELEAKKLGIVGYGKLGQAVAKLAKAFGMEVLISARPGEDTIASGRVALNDLAAEVDILSLHCPLTSATQSIIDNTLLEKMRPEAWVINTARGALIDEHALKNALIEGKIGGAALDVLSLEPPENNPLLSIALPNLIITPHSAWASIQARQRLVDKIVLNINEMREMIG